MVPWLLVVAMLAGAAQAVAAGYPDFGNPRYKEDWRGFDSPGPAQPLDAIKFLPLSADASWWLSIGGEGRARFEVWDGFDFGAPPDNDDSYVLGRLRVHGDLHWGESLRLFGEAISGFAVVDRNLPGGNRAGEIDEADALNAFLEVGPDPFKVRVGRQELLLGKQRLVSPANWKNSRQTFDGISAWGRLGSLRVTGFWTRPVRVLKFDFNEPDNAQEFYGVYATGALGNAGVKFDLYWMRRDKELAAFNGSVGDEQRHTVGGRLFGTAGAADFEMEVAYQFGELGSSDIDAFMVNIEVGHRWREAAGQPRAWIALDYASGDDNPGGDVQTFDPLYPTGHAFFGYTDVIGRFNIIDLHPGASWSPWPKARLSAHHHVFWRADADDALYRPGAGIVRDPGLDNDRYVGSNLDLVAAYSLNRQVTVTLGYSHFFTGDFIRGTGSNEDIQLAYLIGKFTF